MLNVKEVSGPDGERYLVIQGSEGEFLSYDPNREPSLGWEKRIEDANRFPIDSTGPGNNFAKAELLARAKIYEFLFQVFGAANARGFSKIEDCVVRLVQKGTADPEKFVFILKVVGRSSCRYISPQGLLCTKRSQAMRFEGSSPQEVWDNADCGIAEIAYKYGLIVLGPEDFGIVRYPERRRRVEVQPQDAMPSYC